MADYIWRESVAFISIHGLIIKYVQLTCQYPHMSAGGIYRTSIRVGIRIFIVASELLCLQAFERHFQ